MAPVRQESDHTERQCGVDATHLTGAMDAALDRLIEARAAVEDAPNIGRCREYVAAHDAFWVLVKDVARAA